MEWESYYDPPGPEKAPRETWRRQPRDSRSIYREWIWVSLASIGGIFLAPFIRYDTIPCGVVALPWAWMAYTVLSIRRMNRADRLAP